MKTIASFNSLICAFLSYITFMFVDFKDIVWDWRIFIFSIIFGLLIFVLHFSVKQFIKGVIEITIKNEIEKQIKILRTDIDRRFYHLYVYSKETNQILINEIFRVRCLLYNSYPMQIDKKQDDVIFNDIARETTNFERNFPEFKELKKRYEPD